MPRIVFEVCQNDNRPPGEIPPEPMKMRELLKRCWKKEVTDSPSFELICLEITYLCPEDEDSRSAAESSQPTRVPRNNAVHRQLATNHTVGTVVVTGAPRVTAMQRPINGNR